MRIKEVWSERKDKIMQNDNNNYIFKQLFSKKE